MWFKNILALQCAKPIDYQPEWLEKQLEECAYRPCPAKLPMSSGWVSPIQLPDAPLVHTANGVMLICLAIEEKILPSNVLRQKVGERVLELEAKQERKLRKREKDAIRDQLYHTLLPQAFSKTTRIYAYFDTRKNWLLINSVSKRMNDFFFSMLEKSLPELKLEWPDIKRLPTLMTEWLRNDSLPASFGIGKACVLQDPNQSTRMIRAQQQDLQAGPIQSLLKDGCEAVQLALTWAEQISFTLKEDFTLRSLKFHDAVLDIAKDHYSETEAQKFDADFAIMSDTLQKLLEMLMPVCLKEDSKAELEVKEIAEPV